MGAWRRAAGHGEPGEWRGCNEEILMKKILIIEDDPITTKIYRQSFVMSGYEVAIAADGEAGLQQVHDFKPDVVQLDLMLPKLNGVEVTRRIRAQPEYKSLPIIVVSNCYVTDMITEAWRAGINKCIPKINSSPKLMLDLIAELLNSSKPSPDAPPAVATTPPPPNPFAADSPSPAVQPANVGVPPLEPIEVPFHASGFGSVTAPGEIGQEFLNRAALFEADLRNRLHSFVKNSGQPAQLFYLRELTRFVRGLGGYAGIAGLVRISHLAGALEILLDGLQQKPAHITPSTMRTIAHAVDCLGHLLDKPPDPQDDFSLSAVILAVDDEPISRRTLRAALLKANLRTISLDDPKLALRILAENRFDLIFLDVDMPGMDGFELCRKIRVLPGNQKTPVVFITSQADFESRARSSLSGGTDLIAKPFPLIELAVKALTFIVAAKSSSMTSVSVPPPASPGG
jgi:CheY-like chemotaxis protein